MIETGYYIERVFPLLRIRFIAVSDSHDSAEHEGDTGGMEIAFKFLIHEQYSKDLSLKIKSAKRAKALRGEYVTKNCAFGYKKVDNRLEIDEPAAETVRMIYGMAASGLSLAKIAARLYEEKRPTPTEYKKHSRQVLAKDFSCLWNKPYILEILSDEQYIGTYVAGKTKTLEVGSGKAVKVDESDWIRIPNHHPPIIDKAVFNAARERIDQRGEPLRNRKLGTWQRYKENTSPLQRKVFCGCCGHTMKLSSTKNAAFHCDFTRAAPDAECYRHKMLGIELEAIVLAQIRKQARAILKSMDDTMSQAVPKTELESRITQIEDAKLALYEKFVFGEIGADEYTSEKSGLDDELTRMKNAGAILAKEAAKKASVVGFRQAAEDALKAKKLSQPIVDALIVRVCVYPDGRVEVVTKVPQ